MRIGILTFHCAHNYGAVLQCYALQETIKKMGHYVDVIDYRPHYILNSYSLFSFNKKGIGVKTKIKILFRDLLLFPLNKSRSLKFAQFVQKHLNLSTEVVGNQIPSDYDVYIVGSDQIWNKEITCGYDPVFFCDFSFEKIHRKYVSYAASLEPRGLSSIDFNCLSTKLMSLDAISVRESVLAESLSMFLARNVHTVLDPTLLMRRKIWDQICGTRICNEDYIVLYQARYSEDIARQARRLAKSMNCKLIEMSAWTIPVKKMLNPGMNASPEDFLNFIKYAKLVINTSFHGTVFSIIYEVPFYYIKLSDGWDSRAISLLESLNLANRALTMNELNEVKVEDIAFDFSDVRCAIKKLRGDSMSFIKDSLKL